MAIPQTDTDGYNRIHSQKLTFSFFVSKIRPYFSFGSKDEKENAHTFLSAFLGSFCDIEEDENDNSLEFKQKTAASYINGSRNLPEKLVKKIIRKKDKPKFQNILDDCNDDNVACIVKDFLPYIPEITEDNYSAILTDCFEEILHSIIENKTVSQTPKKKNKKAVDADFSEAIKTRLYLETNGYCAIPACREKLSINKDGNILFTFNPTIIDGIQKSDDIHNLIALCPTCAQKYLTAQTKEDIGNLKSIKEELEKTAKIHDIAYNEQIQDEIIVILAEIPKLTDDYLEKLNLDPVPLTNKFEKNDYLLKNKIDYYVKQYYNYITLQSQELTKQNLFDYEVFASQIRTLFLKLEKQNISKSEIFEQLSTKLKDCTGCEMISCEAVIASLVQRCDVFREVKNATT